MRKLLPLVLVLGFAHATGAQEGMPPPAPTPAPPPAASADGMPRSAFLLDLRIGGAVPLAIGGLGATTAFSALPSIGVGVRLIGRLQLSMGFTFFRTESSSGSNTNLFNLVPTIAVDQKSPLGVASANAAAQLEADRGALDVEWLVVFEDAQRFVEVQTVRRRLDLFEKQRQPDVRQELTRLFDVRPGAEIEHERLQARRR